MIRKFCVNVGEDTYLGHFRTLYTKKYFVINRCFLHPLLRSGCRKLLLVVEFGAINTARVFDSSSSVHINDEHYNMKMIVNFKSAKATPFTLVPKQVLNSETLLKFPENCTINVHRTHHRINPSGVAPWKNLRSLMRSSYTHGERKPLWSQGRTLG